MTRAQRPRQFVHLRSNNRAGAGKGTGPGPSVKIRVEARVPRVDEQYHSDGLIDRSGEIRLHEPVELARRRVATPRVSISGEIHQIQRPRRATLHPVEIGEPRLARRGARAGQRSAHQRIDQARFADIGSADQSDLRQPISRKVTCAGGARDELCRKSHLLAQDSGLRARGKSVSAKYQKP